MTFASASGSFSTVLGLGSTFTEAINPSSFDLYAFQNPVELQAGSVTTPASATVGQPVTINWQVADQGPSNATGSWQDSVYLSETSTITSSSILLGTAEHSGGLIVNASYVGTLSVSVPALAPGSYYVLVQVDSLYQVPDPDRAENTLAASTGQIDISIPSLTLGTPYSDSFTAADQDRYYQIAVNSGSSLLLTMSGSPASEDNAIYIRFDELPTTYQADFQTSPSVGPNPSLAVPLTQPGTYYVLVHNQSGGPGSYTLTATQPNLTLTQESPSTIGNAGQATLAVDGLDLEPDTTYSLVGPGGTVAAATVQYVNASQAYVRRCSKISFPH